MNISKNTFSHASTVFAVALLFSLVLSGCGTEENPIKEYTEKNNSEISENLEENEENKNPEISQQFDTPMVKVIQVGAEDNAPALSLSGTLVAKDEVTVSAEASGVVAQVWKKEGGEVVEGERILMLNTGDNLALAAYNSASLAKKNAAIALQLYQESASSEIKSAEISNKQAQVSLEQSRRTNGSEKKSIISQTQAAESQKKLAETNLEIAQTALSQTEENEKKIQKNILENTGNTLSQTLVNFRSSMNMADELLGASVVNKKTNDEIEVYLEGTTVGIMLPTQDLWRKTDPKILAVEAKFRNFEKDTYTPEDENEMIALSQSTLENAKNLRKILRNLETMLKESIPAPSFPQTKIDALKAQMVQHQNILEQNIAQLSQMDQALSDFHIQSPQRVTNAQMRVAVAESQLNSAEQNYFSSKNSGSSKSIGVDTAYEQAKQKFRASQNQVQSAKIKTRLSVQSARAQLDSANAQLAQAEISLSKLTIRSGIHGTITKLLKREGDTVSMGIPVVIIADYSSLKLKGDVSVSERLKLKKGMKAEIFIEDINKTVEGELSLIFPEADKITKRVPIEITVPNPAGIPANIFATAKILLSENSSPVTISKELVQTENVAEEKEKPEIKYFVWKAEFTDQCNDLKDKGCFVVKKTNIEVDSSSNFSGYTVLNGLSKGEKIIAPFPEISEGMEVKLSE